MSKNGQIGFKDIHVGLFTGDGQPYTGNMKLEGALSGKIEIKEGSTPFYSDDNLNNVVNNLEEISLELETAGLSLEEQAFILGETLDQGVIASSTNDLATRPYIGVAFTSEKVNGGLRYVSLPKVKFTPVTSEYKTKGDKTEMSTTTLVGTAMPLNTGVYKVVADSDATGVNQAFLDSFLTTIPQAGPTKAKVK